METSVLKVTVIETYFFWFKNELFIVQNQPWQILNLGQILKSSQL